MLTKETYMGWLSEFFNKKSNELEYSQRQQPKRMQRVVFDLSAAPSQPVELNVPFKTLIVSRIYSTAAPATDKAGSLKVMFDEPNLANIDNAISLFPNDTLKTGTQVRKAFFTWEAQSDTSCVLYVYPDIEVVAGTTKTQIVGTTTVTLSSISASAQRLAAPTLTTTITSTGGTPGNYTVPSGKVARVTISGQISAASSGFSASINGLFAVSFGTPAAVTSSNVACPTLTLKAGDALIINTSATGCTCAAFIEEYPL